MASLAVWALYEHVVAPALRFLVTHPANQVIDELGERLRIGIRPFQRTKRQALIHSLLADRRSSEEHTSELQSHVNIVCRLLLETKKNLEGRLQRLRRAKNPPAPNELAWISRLAERFGVRVSPHASAVFAELSERIFFVLTIREPPRSTLFPYTTLFR